ncbi:FAD-dependent oxidoreductase [Actinomadura sp. CNU-125]|uniref:FAD-dependent oxidoreductase n=1 Tax=Actinomadura sp. CNU-125 TaxID=1904961 RepID=UPI000B076AE1|nr:FAD-dependent oxidoreductase [Actinomadura sp. CNU-125]
MTHQTALARTDAPVPGGVRGGLAAYARLAKLDIYDYYLGLPLVWALLVPAVRWDAATFGLLGLVLLAEVVVVAAMVGFDDITGFRDGSDAANYGSDAARRRLHRKPLVAGTLTEPQALRFAWAATAIGTALWAAAVVAAPHRPVWAAVLAAVCAAASVQYSWGLKISYRGFQELFLIGLGIGWTLVPYALLTGAAPAFVLVQAVVFGAGPMLFGLYSNTNDADGDRAAGRITVATLVSARTHRAFVAAATGALVLLIAGSVGGGRAVVVPGGAAPGRGDAAGAPRDRVPGRHPAGPPDRHPRPPRHRRAADRREPGRVRDRVVTDVDVDVAVVGAGPAGLAAAHALAATGRTVRVLEAADAVGGRMRTVREHGCLIDIGAEMFPDRPAYPATWRLISALGLDADPAAVPRVPDALAVWRGGRTRPHVGRPLGLLTGAGLPVRARLDLVRLQARLARFGDLDPQRPEHTSLGAATVAELVRPYHRDLRGYLVEPLVAGFFGWDPGRSAAAPFAAHLATSGGTGGWRTYRDGMDTLARALADRLDVVLGSP